MKIVVNRNRKNNKIIQFVPSMLNITVENVGAGALEPAPSPPK
jgi:hypothetical protein